MAFFSSMLSRNLPRLGFGRQIATQLVLVFIVVAGGMGLPMKAELFKPLGGKVGGLWVTLSTFSVGAALTFLLIFFFNPRNSPSSFAQPAWQLFGGVLGPIYVIILTVVTPVIDIAMTVVDILAGQVFKSLAIDHFGLLGTSHRKIDSKRTIALILIIATLVMAAQG